MKKLLLLLIPLLIFAGPVKYGNSTHYKGIQLKAANIYEADTNVPIVLSGSGLEDVISGAVYTGGHDIVVTNTAGTDLGRQIASFNKTNDTLQLYYTDPATHPTNAGTQLWLQWGGDSVANDLTIWQNCHGSTDDYVLVIHGEETSANLTDATGNYSPTDTDITYAQTGKILKAPSFNGTSSFSDVKYIPLVNPDTEFSISMWINPTDHTATKPMFGAAFGVYNFYARIWSSDIDIFVRNSTGTYTTRTTGDNLTAGWQRLAMVKKNDGKFYVYRDGVELAYTLQDAIVGTSPSYSSISLGEYAGYWGGEIDEFNIFTGALSENQDKTQYDIQNGFATNATVTIGSTKSFSSTKRKAYQRFPYQNDDYQRGAYQR